MSQKRVICPKCGESYLPLNPLCLCTLEQEWRDLERYHLEKAQRCSETAALIAARISKQVNVCEWRENRKKL